VAVHIGLMMIAIMGMAALGTEMMYLLYQQRQIQAVADASALSGATAVALHFPSHARSEVLNDRPIRVGAMATGFVSMWLRQERNEIRSSD